MGAQYKPVKGDRVRVVLEGEVRVIGAEGFGVGGVNHVFPRAEEVISVEKIEPGAVLPDGLTISEDGSHLNWLGENYVRQHVEEPVEVFKPGDVVRSKAEPDWLYLIGTDGYVEVGTGRYYADGPNTRDVFTSRYYEKVSLG